MGGYRADLTLGMQIEMQILPKLMTSMMSSTRGRTTSRGRHEAATVADRPVRRPSGSRLQHRPCSPQYSARCWATCCGLRAQPGCGGCGRSQASCCWRSCSSAAASGRIECSGCPSVSTHHSPLTAHHSPLSPGHPPLTRKPDLPAACARPLPVPGRAAPDHRSGGLLAQPEPSASPQPEPSASPQPEP